MSRWHACQIKWIKIPLLAFKDPSKRLHHKAYSPDCMIKWSLSSNNSIIRFYWGKYAPKIKLHPHRKLIFWQVKNKCGRPKKYYSNTQCICVRIQMSVSLSVCQCFSHMLTRARLWSSEAARVKFLWGTCQRTGFYIYVYRTFVKHLWQMAHFRQAGGVVIFVTKIS